MDLEGSQLKTGYKEIPSYVLVLIKMKVATVGIGVLIMLLLFVMVVSCPIVVMGCLGFMLFFVDMRNDTVGKDHGVRRK